MGHIRNVLGLFQRSYSIYPRMAVDAWGSASSKALHAESQTPSLGFVLRLALSRSDTVTFDVTPSDSLTPSLSLPLSLSLSLSLSLWLPRVRAPVSGLPGNEHVYIQGMDVDDRGKSSGNGNIHGGVDAKGKRISAIQNLFHRLGKSVDGTQEPCPSYGIRRQEDSIAKSRSCR